jgi:hypothetical protein
VDLPDRKASVGQRDDRKAEARLEVYSTLSQQPAWRIADDAVKQLLETIPAEDKRAVEGVAKRIEAHHAVPQ